MPVGGHRWGSPSDGGALTVDAGTPDAGPVTDGCTSNRDCSGRTPFCAVASGACVACLQDADCMGSMLQCSADHQCVLKSGTCYHDTDCTSASARFCDADSHQCVQCQDTTQCGANQVCIDAQCQTPQVCGDTENCPSGYSCDPMPNNTSTNYLYFCALQRSGGRAGGASCHQDTDCRSSVCVHFGTNETDGTCTEACSPGGVSCAPNTQCLPQGVLGSLIGPDQVAGTSDDVTLAVHVCWPKSCAVDSDCAGLSADLAKPRTCGMIQDLSNPSNTSAVLLTCNPQLGSVQGNGRCTTDADCASGSCQTWSDGNGSSGSVCFKPCRSAADCAFTEQCLDTGLTQHNVAVLACVPLVL